MLCLINKPEHTATLFSVFDNILRPDLKGHIPSLQDMAAIKKSIQDFLLTIDLISFLKSRIDHIHSLIDINNDIVFIKNKKTLIPIVKSIICRCLERTEISISEHGDHHTEHHNRYDKNNRIIAAKYTKSLHDHFNAHDPDSCNHITDPFFLQACASWIPH